MEFKQEVEIVAAKLQKLGIVSGTDTILKNTVDEIEQLPKEVQDVIWKEQGKEEVENILLTKLGDGTYDYAEGNWTPSSKKVFAFDTEVFDVGRMYTLFLEGIRSITEGEIAITQVQEDCSLAEYEEGTGTQIIRFLCNGTPCEFRAVVEFDWFDMKMVSYMKQVIEEAKTGKSLWITDDGCQQCILFYNTKEWAEEFSKLMGRILE